MALPIIPLQDNIREGEGYGSAFILPREQRKSAIDVLADDYRMKKQEQALQDKAFADELAALDSLGKGLLPNDEKTVRDMYANHINWIGQQGKTGGSNPANPSSGNYLENKKRMNEMTSIANIGRYRKELLKDIQAKALTGDYDEESLNKTRDYITNSPINEFDPNKVGQIEKRFNIDSYEDAALSKVQLPQSTTFKQKAIVGGKKVGDEITSVDIEPAVEILINDNSYQGQRAKKQYLDTYANLPEAEQKRITDAVIKKNASAKNNVDLLREGVIREVASQRAKRRYGNKVAYKEYDVDDPRSSGDGGKTFDDQYEVTRTNTPTEDKRFTNTSVKTGQNKRTVSVKRKGGKSQEKFELTVNGKPVTPVNYVVNDDTGEVEFNFLGLQPAIDKKGREILNANGMPIYDQKPQTIILDDQTYTDIAAELGFGGDGGVERFKSQVLKLKGGKPAGGGKTITQAEWRKLTPLDRKKKLSEGYKVK